MNKKKRKIADWRFRFTMGLLVLVLLVGAGSVSGAFDLKAKLAEILLSRIDVVIEQNLAASIEYLDEEEAKFGGLVEVFRKVFPQGLIIGANESQNIFLTDSSNNLYIGTSTDATFIINASTGRITMRNINFTTSSLNWGGNFSAGTDDLYVDIANQRVGIGTSTPNYQLEVSNAADVVLALTATSTNDTIIRMNTVGGAQEWLIYMDNSDNDMLKIGTSSDRDILTIDDWGNVTILKGLAMATSSISGTLSVTGATTLSGATTLATTTAETFIGGGTVLSTTTATGGKFTASDICSNSMIVSLVNVAATVTLPSTTTLAANCLPNVGDYKWVTFDNTTTTGIEAEGALTIGQFPAADGGGIRLVSASSTGEIITPPLIVDALFKRTSNNTTTVFLYPHLDID